MTDAPRPRVTSPFGYRSTALEVVRGHDLSGRVVLVTGASSGLGIETARAFLETGATVVLPFRDEARGDAALAALRESHPDADLETGRLDLASLDSIRAFATTFLERHSSLDVLVNNAAVMATPQGVTVDGFELQIGTNHLGHFALTSALLPALASGEGARVVALSSIAHRRSPVHLDDLFFEHRPYDKWNAYGQSKTACALFAVALNERYGPEGVTANAVSPGGIMTGLQQHMTKDELLTLGWIDNAGQPNELFKTVEQGAATSVWAGVGADLDGIGGLYLEDCAQALPFDPALPVMGVVDYALDPVVASALWERSSELTGA